MGAEEEPGSPSTSINQSGTGPRRKVNRSNPQLSYAYGAPSDGKKILKKPRTSKDVSVENGVSASPPPAPATTGKFDAATRYKAIKERQQQQHQSPIKGSTSGAGNVDSPRRSARLSASGSQDGVPTQERRKAIAAIEEDQAVEEEEEEKASSSASQQRRRRLMSPGQSRSANTHVSSFYLDANRSHDDGENSEGMNGLPTSLLRGAQRQRHDPLPAELSGLGMQSVRSSDFGDSRSHDYTEEEKYAQMLDQSHHQASISTWSPKSWFKSKAAQVREPEKDGDIEGESSLEKKKRKARVSADNQLYRPETDEHHESDSGTSLEGRKHSHRKKKVDVKGGARGGRDDKKIWMTSNRRCGGKRRSMDGREEDISGEMSGENSEGEEEGEGEGEVDEEIEQIKDVNAAMSPKKTKQPRPGVKYANNGSSIPRWAIFLGALLLLGSLGLNLRAKSNDPLDYSSVSSLVSSLSAPKSLAEASERIVKLESAFEALKAAGSNAAKEEIRLAARLTHLESETEKTSRQFVSSQAAMQRHIKSTEVELSRIKAEMGRLQSRLQSMQADTRANDAAVSDALKKRLDSLEHQLKETDRQLHDVAERAKAAERIATEARKSLDWLERKLPAEVAVPIQATTGKPTLDAATWQELKKLFVSKEEADFQTKNEKMIRSLSLETLEGQMKTGVVISREHFLQLLHSELDQAKASMEAKFNSNVGEMQNDILAKVRAQQDMFEKSGSWKKSQRGSVQDYSEYDNLEAGGSDAKQAIVALIEAALETYSADRIGRRDFALYSAGARVIPSLTSPTYNLQSRSLFGWSSKRQETVKPPVIALYHESSPGMCWAFNGDDGQLGIGLARKVIVSDVTLEHIAASISLEAGTSAPRDVTVWGLVERQEDRRRLIAHRMSQQQQQQQQDDGDYLDSPAPAPPSNNHLLLASFTYDIESNRAIQTFPASKEARQLQIPVSVVQVRVTSNHGNKDFTCLYRIRVHGQEWTGED